MKIGICSALACKLDDSLKYIGVDHGVEILLKQGIKPVFAIGDFDSIENENVLSELDIERLPTRKDVTDTHAALEYGVTGGRLDHFLSVMCLLEKYADKKIRIIDQQNVIQLLLPGTHKVYQDEYKYFSLYALDDAYIDIDGAEYPLNQYFLQRQDPLCVSNQVSCEIATITNSKPIVLVKSKDA